MCKDAIIVVIGMAFLLYGCSSFHHYRDKSPIEIEQLENPEIWDQVRRIQVILWPLERKVNEIEKKVNDTEKKVNKIEKNVNEMKDELATTKLSSIQANKDIETLHAEIQLIKSESISREKSPVDMIRTVEIKDKKDLLKMGTTKVTGESNKVGPDIKSKTIKDIQYHKVSDTQEKVLIYVNAVNNPKLQTLKGETPRIVLDFFNTHNIEKEKYEINTDGNLIKKIRIRSFKEPIQKVRIVLDMMPDKQYSVDQKFSKKENIYSFDLKAK